MKVRRESARAPWPVSSVLWIAGALLLLAPPWIRWTASPVSLTVPLTPVDRVNFLYAHQWAFLHGAKEAVPPGQTYTTIARDRDEEMLLFMLSLGVLTNRHPVPSSYFRAPVREGAEARFVISYGCLEPEGARLLRRLPAGCVWERPARP